MLLPFVILKFCPEHNINTFRDINLQPFSNKPLFGELILLFYKVRLKQIDMDLVFVNEIIGNLIVSGNDQIGKWELSLYKKGITVKTLYNVTRYNRIFNIRHKFAGNGSVSIKIPSL